MSDGSPLKWRLAKYQVEAEVGRGAMGAVYRGYDVLLDRYVAIKVLAPHLVWEKDFVDRFLREARMAARLNHPVIVSIYEVGQEANQYYLVMEYVEGETLADFIRERGALVPTEVPSILRPLAEALDYAHGRGLIHRDVKPANIIVSPEGAVKLTDFGMARAIEQTHLTAAGTIVGTPNYMSPEQARGRRAGAHSDQYSLAVVAYEMLSGQIPFQAESTASLVFKVAAEPPPSIRQVRPELPEEVDVVLERALAKEPGERFETATAFVEALAEALAERQDRKVTVAETKPGWHRVLTWGWMLGGLAVLALIVGLAIAAVGGSGGSADVPSATETTTIAVVVRMTATPSPSPFVSTATPSLTPAATASPTPTATPSSTPSATASPVPTPLVAAVVLSGGTELRPGATTWWRARQTLPAGTELELLGYDPNFSGWVYVRAADDGVEGWTQLEKLEIYRELATLPRVTPRPTLTSTPDVSPPAECEGGPLLLDAWPVGTACTSGGWEASIFVEGRGGDCRYTYAWEGEIQAGPMSGSTTFTVSSADRYAPIIGKASVTSAGRTVTRELFVSPPECGN
jgi:serine/threonine-protein kinase